MTRDAATPARVAVLYSGRWFWPTNRPWVRNHLEKLIEPNHADVMLISSWESFCSPAATATRGARAKAERLLQDELREAFGRFALAAKLIDEPAPHALKGMMALMREAVTRAAPRLDASAYANSVFKAGNMFTWRKQAAKVALVELFRRSMEKGHDLVIKTRIDLELRCPLPLLSLRRAEPWRIFAVPAGLSTTHWDASIIWRDWLYVTSQAGAAAYLDIGKKTDRLLFNTSVRCHGFCPEEQAQLQLEARGLVFTQLATPPWSLVVRRFTDLPGALTPASSALRWDCLSSAIQSGAPNTHVNATSPWPQALVRPSPATDVEPGPGNLSCAPVKAVKPSTERTGSGTTARASRSPEARSMSSRVARWWKAQFDSAGWW